MMKDIPKFYVEELARPLKNILLLFVVTIGLGYGFGLRYMYITSGVQPDTIQEQYLGNESNEDAEMMKFKKTEKGILTFLHDHLFALGLIQLILSLLIYFTKTSKRLKSFLIYEPFLSIIVTFSSIYLMWSGMTGLKYLVMVSGTLFHLTFVFSLLFIGYKLIKK